MNNPNDSTRKPASEPEGALPSASARGWAIRGQRWDVEREQMLTFTVPVVFQERHEAVRELAIINTIPTEWDWEIIESPNATS